MDKVVENGRGPEVAIRFDIGMSILKYHQRGRLRGVVLRGYVNVIASNGTGINVAFIPDIFGNRALWRPLDRERVRGMGVARFDSGLLPVKSDRGPNGQYESNCEF